jgi:hypothetical protein
VVVEQEVCEHGSLQRLCAQGRLVRPKALFRSRVVSPCQLFWFTSASAQLVIAVAGYKYYTGLDLKQAMLH